MLTQDPDPHLNWVKILDQDPNLDPQLGKNKYHLFTAVERAIPEELPTDGGLLEVGVHIRDQVHKEVHIVLLTLPHVVHCTQRVHK